MDTLSFTLRINEELMEKLRKIAEKNKRSVNSELLYLIEKYIEEQEKKTNE